MSDPTPMELARNALAKQTKRGHLSMLGPRIFKSAYYAKRWLRSIVTRARMSLVWKFEGPVVFSGPVYARAISGSVTIGPKVMFGPFVTLDCAADASVRIGHGATINQGTFIVALQRIDIGRYVSIGEYCSIRDNDHDWQDGSKPIRHQGFVAKPVVIEDDVWIGRGVTIGKGVHIGRGAIVGANAVVVKDVEPYAIVGGVPAKVLKFRARPDAEQRL